MKTIITIIFLFSGQFIYSQTLDSLQQLKKDFSTDSCGTSGLRLKYFRDSKNDETNEPFSSNYIYKKTKNEILALLGKPNSENKNGIHYIIKANKCNGSQKLTYNIGFDKGGKSNSTGLTKIGFPKEAKK